MQTSQPFRVELRQYQAQIRRRAQPSAKNLRLPIREVTPSAKIAARKPGNWVKRMPFKRKPGRAGGTQQNSGVCKAVHMEKWQPYQRHMSTPGSESNVFQGSQRFIHQQGLQNKSPQVQPVSRVPGRAPAAARGSPRRLLQAEQICSQLSPHRQRVVQERTAVICSPLGLYFRLGYRGVSHGGYP